MQTLAAIRRHFTGLLMQKKQKQFPSSQTVTPLHQVISANKVLSGHNEILYQFTRAQGLLTLIKRYYISVYLSRRQFDGRVEGCLGVIRATGSVPAGGVPKAIHRAWDHLCLCKHQVRYELQCLVHGTHRVIQKIKWSYLSEWGG